MSAPGDSLYPEDDVGRHAPPPPSGRGAALRLCSLFLAAGALWLLLPALLSGDPPASGMAWTVLREALFLVASAVVVYLLARRALAPPTPAPVGTGEAFSPLSHDLRNVLTVVSGHAELALERSSPGHALHGDLLALRNATRRGLELAGGVRAAGQAPDGSDLARLAGDAGRVLPRLAGPDIAVELDLELAVAPVRVPAPELEQVLLNLALNACEAMPRGGTLRIVLRAEHGQAVLEVGDTGPGLDEATRQRLFEPGFTTRPGGHGIGLAGAARTLRRAGGTLEALSAPGHGSTFRVRLPLAGPAIALPGGQGELLLVLEPDAARRRELGRRLSAAGYRVRPAEDAGEAALTASEEAPALLLLGDDAAAADLARRLAPLPIVSSHLAAHELLAAVRTALDAALPAAPATRTVPRAEPNGRLALVVDDEAQVREVVARMLQDGGWDTELASHGAMAVELARRTRPALVLLDMLMPDMEGIETLGRLREACPGTPVIAMSGAAHAADYLVMARHLGATAVLPKPFEGQALLALAEQVLRTGDPAAA